MKNRSKIKGDGNINIQDVFKSNVGTGDRDTFGSKTNIWIILPVILAAIALLVQILIGWEQLIKWLYAR